MPISIAVAKIILMSHTAQQTKSAAEETVRLTNMKEYNENSRTYVKLPSTHRQKTPHLQGNLVQHSLVETEAKFHP